jgi:tRNA pseudouridine55 synthase
MQYDFIKGEILLFDKPAGWTSFDLVNKVKHLLKRKLGVKKIKVGHAGTLDPLASGLLIVCTGAATKRIDELQSMEKEYTGTFEIGATTPSFDRETDIDQRYPTDHITEELIHQSAHFFEKRFEQIPPIFSAIKVDGKRAYDYARENLELELKGRPVSIQTFNITRIEMPEVDIQVICSKGTYIRSLARDFGTELKSGAYMTQLRRTRIGQHHVDNALDVMAFAEFIKTTYTLPAESES